MGYTVPFFSYAMKRKSCGIARISSVVIYTDILFNLHHSVTNADMRLDILRRIVVLLQLFAERRHKYAKRSNIVIPTAAPNTLGNKGMG